MIVCPRCSYENEDSAMNCANCRVNLQWALENPYEAVRPTLERAEGPPPEGQARDRAARIGTSLARGFLVIALLLVVPASGILALSSFLEWSMTPSYNRSGGDLAIAGFWLVVALVCVPAAIVVLLRRQPKPNVLGGLRVLALIGVTGGLLFGLMRLTLVILPEHTGRSLIVQYKLGERDFSGVSLEQADLAGADLHEANLSDADLRGADLTGAQLYRNDLSGADLTGANLHEANLGEANLREGDLRGADLTGVQLYGANLSGADLREADLTKANLFRSILYGANLSGAAVTNQQLAKAESLEGTILPNGSVHE